MLRYGTPVVRDVPPLATLRLYGHCIIMEWTLWSQTVLFLVPFLGQFKETSPVQWQYEASWNIKKFIKELHVTLRYNYGMKRFSDCSPKQKGSVRKRHFIVIYARSFVFLYFDFCVCLVHPSVTHVSVFYFMYGTKQRLSVTRQGRFEMVRGKVHRNVHCLATILWMLKIICNPAMRTTRALRICNAAKYTDDVTRQSMPTYFVHIFTSGLLDVM